MKGTVKMFNAEKGYGFIRTEDGRDAFFHYSDNEGHIFAKITNDSNEGKVISVKKGEAFIQGVFLSYGITEDDEVNSIRNGGFGSTSK